MKITDDAIFERLSGDAALVAIVGAKIWRDGSVPPDDPETPAANFPRVVYGQAAGTPGYTYDRKSKTRVVYLIKGIESGFSSAIVNEINARLEALFTLLEGETIAADGATIVYSRRVRDVEGTEKDGDQSYQHLGGEWEMEVAF